MKKIIKNVVNWPLKKMGLKIVRERLEAISYSRLFDDLPTLFNTQSPMVLDVGANVGQTVDSILEVFERPIIHAFEPSSSVFVQLTKKRYRGSIFLHNLALGERDEQREFINYKWSTMSSFLELSRHESNRFKDVEIDEKEIVTVATVDGFVTSQKIEKVDLLKIDTQGFDMRVLKGARESLASGVVDHVLVELNFVEMYDHQSSFYEVIDLLESNGLFLIDYYEKIREKHTIAWCTALFGRR